IADKGGHPRPFILSISTIRTCVWNSTRRSKPWDSLSHEAFDCKRQHVGLKKSLRGYPLTSAASLLAAHSLKNVVPVDVGMKHLFSFLRCINKIPFAIEGKRKLDGCGYRGYLKRKS